MMRKNIMLLLKGVGMGAADVIPGVSGGTIAFITGIYEELLLSIKNFPKSFKILFSEGFSVFFKASNLKFLLLVFAGIGISVLSLANALQVLLFNYSIFVWSFFFGLIIASAIYVGKAIGDWSWSQYLSLIIGVVLAYWISCISPSQTSEEYWFIFLVGSVAISAMILPGISGSFILLLFGKYEFIISAISEMKLDILAFFMGGVVVGLLLFSNALSWMLKKYYDITVALLTGFMIGSLNKVWPWKQTLTSYTDRHGDLKPLTESSILPTTYSELIGDSYWIGALLMAILGFLIIFAVERVASRMTKKRQK